MNYNALRSAQDCLRLAPGARELGSLLWWHLNGNRISHPELEALASRHGLDAKYIPNDLKPTQAFRRAWRHATTKLPDGLMLRMITEGDDIVVGLVRERPDQSRRDLDYDLVARIIFDKTNETITSDVEHGVIEQIRELYRHHLAHTSEDVRSMMTSFLSEAGVSLRDSGGVYFVPSSHSSQLEALCRVVQDIGHNKTFVLPIVDTPETKATLREVAERTLDDEIRQLEEELAGFDFEKVRDSTLERRLESFEQLRSRAGLFANVLSFKADALSRRIALMQSGIRQHLGLDPIPAPASITKPDPIPAPFAKPAKKAIAPFSADVGF